ncbi:MAG: 2-oxo acid dehydrogenase subunit E2 [Actinobacteria bacterium]|nr:2-oxo acid dehydrogenase subunit E2 [Actinomycetota bacterium]
MITEVFMPVLGLTMESATIIEWVAREGDAIAVDDTLLVVETDKAATDVPSPAGGILGRIVVIEGEDIPVGTVLAYIVTSADEIPGLPVAAPPAPPALAPAVAPLVAPEVAREVAPSAAEAVPNDPLPAPGPDYVPAAHATPGDGGRVFASPRARVRAAALGLDLAAIPHSGERIIEEDVLRAAASGADSAAAVRLTPLAAKLAAELGIDPADLDGAPMVRVKAADLLRAAAAAEAAGPSGAIGTAPTAAGPTFQTGDRRRLNRVRRITAERMTENWRTAPQVTYTSRFDMTRAVDLRAQLKDTAAARGVRLTYDAMFLRAAATALLEYPEVNARWAEGEGIELWAEAHVGVAVDLGGEGLIVPVVRNAHSLGLFATAAEVDRLVTAARGGQLGPDDYKGGTFTITNLGLFGIEAFTPIVNLPEAAILGIGAITTTPVFQEGSFVPRQTAMLSLTADHRLVDGAVAARFLGRIRTLMEAPSLLLERGL